MEKVFIVHGFEGTPNGGWRPWLMAELEKKDVYACALPMPTPEDPILGEWIEELGRYVKETDEVYLVGHSLGVPTILHYLETMPDNFSVAGTILVSGPSEKTQNKKTENFYETPFDFESLRKRVGKCVIIHGDNDPYVPLSNAETFSKELAAKLIIIPNGGHLNGSAGFFELPECLDALNKMMM